MSTKNLLTIYTRQFRNNESAKLAWKLPLKLKSGTVSTEVAHICVRNLEACVSTHRSSCKSDLNLGTLSLALANWSTSQVHRRYKKNCSIVFTVRNTKCCKKGMPCFAYTCIWLCNEVHCKTWHKFVSHNERSLLRTGNVVRFSHCTW